MNRWATEREKKKWRKGKQNDKERTKIKQQQKKQQHLFLAIEK